MVFNLTVYAKDVATESHWIRELGNALIDVAGVEISGASTGKDPGQVIFVDAAMSRLDTILAEVPRAGRAVFLIVREGAELPAALADGRVDDVLVAPFRPLEALSKLRYYQQILMWDEVNRLNTSFSETLERLHDDLRLAERLQKSKVPVRFPELKGFKVGSRYLAGMKAGGDHFDLAESRDGNQLSMVLSDSSSYGLSSAVLSVLMRVAMKLTAEEARSCRETMKRIHEELALTLGEKDRLSLFYGTLSRKDYRLRFLNLGSSSAFYAPPKGGFAELPIQGDVITQKSGLPGEGEGEIVLLPESRLVLVSDGFVEAAGGPGKLRVLLDKYREKEAVDSLNEMVFQVKSKFAEPDDLPAQDCTAAVFDVDARVMRVVG